MTGNFRRRIFLKLYRNKPLLMKWVWLYWRFLSSLRTKLLYQYTKSGRDLEPIGYVFVIT